MIGRRLVRGIAHASWLARDFFSLIRGVSRECFAGVIDFSYQHYALGDILTSQVNIACGAIEQGCAGVDLYLIINPSAPGTSVQGFITPENYRTYLDNVFPALLCLPMTRSIRLIRDPLTAGLSVLSMVASHVPMWPSLWDHLGRRMIYPMGHEIINRFHARHGYVPALSAPRGYARWARDFIRQHYRDRFLVCINTRQSRLTHVPAVTYRDAPLPEWYDFFRTVERRYAHAHFFVLGGFSEWEHTLLEFRNVTIPRTMGLTLAHELALLHASDLFLGNSSGFATMATFTRIPYVITHIEQYFAGYAGIGLNAQRYPFASQDQYLVWQREDAPLLLAYFELIYSRCRERNAPELPLTAADGTTALEP